MVFQHFSLFEALTSPKTSPSASARRGTGRTARAHRQVSTEYGLPLDPDRVGHDLSVGERQRIEIVRCLLQNPKLLIMDEPTSVLTPSEVQKSVRDACAGWPPRAARSSISATSWRKSARCAPPPPSCGSAATSRVHPGRKDRQGTGGNHDQHGSARAHTEAAAPKPRPASPDWCSTG
jgi:hypothetical protein